MSKLQKALDELFLYATVDASGDPSVSDDILADLTEHKNTIQRFIEKETELESRRNKLTKGSQWVCVNPGILGGSVAAFKNKIVKVVSVNDNDNNIVHAVTTYHEDTYMFIEQFLFHFAPNEKGE